MTRTENLKTFRRCMMRRARSTAAMAGDKQESFMEHLQKASDEAIDLIYEMFGMKSKGEGSA